MLSDEILFQPTLLTDVLSASYAIVPTGSPFTWVAPTRGAVIVSAGTVSLIQYGRFGVLNTLGITGGIFEISKGDTVRVTYLVPPTMTFIPR